MRGKTHTCIQPQRGACTLLQKVQRIPLPPVCNGSEYGGHQQEQRQDSARKAQGPERLHTLRGM